MEFLHFFAGLIPVVEVGLSLSQRKMFENVCSGSVNECAATLLPLVDTQEITTGFPKYCLWELQSCLHRLLQAGYIITVIYQSTIGQEFQQTSIMVLSVMR